MFMLLPAFSLTCYHVWSSSRTRDTECSPVLEVTGRCDSLSHPVLHDCQAVLSAHPCQLHPLVAAVGGLLSMSELLWTLTLFIHDHLGMRQLKASGNLGFIDISQRPSQAPSAFLSRSATAPPPPPLPPAFLVAVPVLSQWALTAALVWGRRTSF